MLHEQRFFFLASKAIVFALSRVYGPSLLTGYLTNVLNPTTGVPGMPDPTRFQHVEATSQGVTVNFCAAVLWPKGFYEYAPG